MSLLAPVEISSKIKCSATRPPSNDTIVSPVTGEVITVFPTKHALGIKTKSGVELIVHIGIDTVNLNGEGFTALIKQNDKIKAGQPLVKLDMSVLKDKGVV